MSDFKINGIAKDFVWELVHPPPKYLLFPFHLVWTIILYFAYTVQISVSPPPKKLCFSFSPAQPKKLATPLFRNLLKYKSIFIHAPSLQMSLNLFLQL